MKLLLQHGATVDMSDVKGQSPLQVAVKNGHYECAELLLQAGANPNGNSANCSSPLCIAAMNGDLEMVKVCIFNSGNNNKNHVSELVCVLVAAALISFRDWKENVEIVQQQLLCLR